MAIDELVMIGDGVHRDGFNDFLSSYANVNLLIMAFK